MNGWQEWIEKPPLAQSTSSINNRFTITGKFPRFTKLKKKKNLFDIFIFILILFYFYFIFVYLPKIPWLSQLHHWIENSHYWNRVELVKRKGSIFEIKILRKFVYNFEHALKIILMINYLANDLKTKQRDIKWSFFPFFILFLSVFFFFFVPVTGSSKANAPEPPSPWRTIESRIVKLFFT